MLSLYLYTSHLALQISGILFEAIPKLHFDGEEVVVVLLEPPSGSVLVVEGLLHLLKAPERLPREPVKPVCQRRF